MIPYHQQLAFKRRVVEKAYATYSGLNPDQVPAVLPTIPSPNQYGYRTKITPHFDAPPKGKKTEAQGASGSTDPLRKEWELRIGFDQKGRRTVMDIEECPIATDVLNKGLEIARKNVQQTISTYKKGATLLLRDSLAVPVWETNLSNGEEAFTKSVIAETDDQDERHYCITSHKATVRERVGDTLFEFSAGSFFQNNNSALEPLTSHVRDAIFSSSEGEALEPGSTIRKSPTHLVDTYCGSGLFSLTLSPHFSHVAGIEIDSAAIRAAQHNTNLNGLSLSKHKFHAGKSEDIFASVLSSSEETFPPDDTVVVVDPPRKGCDEAFIDQVVSFGPSVLVYVSCNVHTQARDVGMLIRKMEVKSEGSYVLDSLRGFDLFPQTAHVESVAVLRRVVVHSVFH
ncbi:S-adenosyl-L-methionine-dependent methyltransferase [Cantharellus anzutake]|uniref:S-adenosyl-L-methionine-dependent methyltransferase n=1 Tax=Cantharellus anzutake TaxID=1750568 RepID=UPI001903BCE2|nr:S-adenosyl-L-methionine-dependent methyltransferase [Cantharellus anzutake]KAF8330329.1 S-adenosyl-L-methionine-dependent methyltransferase [Cantharellus anzutake]